MGKKLSISFTLGKASASNKVNLKHNNREFIAKNINAKRTADNITFVSENIEDVYHTLFDDALAEYNANQIQKSRRINDYLQYIYKRKGVEPFYEAIVQYGDINTASCESETGKKCVEMLCDYMKAFKKRNPNLYVFNAVLHVDEATPHLHIDFVPYYTKEKKIGLKKGVSMKAALSEQGINSTSRNDNCLIKFEKAERDFMEQILNRHGMEREDKYAHYDHMTVDAYKAHKDIESYKQHLNNAFEIADNVKLQTASIILENQNLKLRLDELKKVEASPYMNFFYSSHDKLSYVLSRLNEDAIDYVETDNGFKAKEYFKKQIRQIEKEFVPSKVNYRDKLREDIDRIIMQSSQYNDVIDELKKIGYEVRRTNYVSVRPDGSKQFIRLNSLGEEYSMQGIINRINNNVFYQNNISENIYKQTEKKIYVGVLHVAQLYFGAFVDNCLPIKKIRQNEPYSWRNDAELDRLAKINNLVCQGADLDTFRQRYSDSEQAFTELQMKIEALEKQLSIKNAMYKYADIFYGGAETTEQISAAAQKVMQKNPHINQDNYKSILKMIENDKQELNNLKQQLDVLTDKLNETKDQLNTIQKIYAGTYMQSLLRDADIERYADEIPSGLDDEIMSL